MAGSDYFTSRRAHHAGAIAAGCDPRLVRFSPPLSLQQIAMILTHEAVLTCDRCAAKVRLRYKGFEGFRAHEAGLEMP